MRRPITLPRNLRRIGSALALALALFSFTVWKVHACTVFVLADAKQALFFNNEDWSNPNTRIWFVPAGEGHYGCAYIGFDDGFAQGGLNTEGLAFDGVAGFDERWEPDPRLRTARGNPSERMLETCATVEDAIAFYQKYWEPDFSRAKLLVADKTGASVIIGAKDGKLHVERADRCRGFGYGKKTLDKMLAKDATPALTNGFNILRACRQQGQYATKYSNVFDLKSGDIFLYPSSGREDRPATLHLSAELAKGGHYYDMPQIHHQLTEAPRPLLNNMKRFFLDSFKPIPDQEPNITERVRILIRDASEGAMQSGHDSTNLWKEFSPLQKEIQTDLKRFGDFTSLALVGRRDENGQRSYRYRLEFKKATVLQHIVFDAQDKVASLRSESVEWRPGVVIGTN